MKSLVARLPFLLFALTLLSPESRGQAIEKAVLDQVKDAAVYIRVKAGNALGMGTGFVISSTGDTVQIMTNRHVVVLDEAVVGEGTKQEVFAVFRSGTPQQKEYSARILAFDESELRDLAVLEVKGVMNPPRPILADQTAAEGEFFETMPVYAVGYPRGEQINAILDTNSALPAITVSAMSIGSLRRDEGSRLARVQLTGSLIEGNSGGPIVDSKGRLVGVAVSRLRGEAVGFAIPPSVITRFLAGDIGGLRADIKEVEGATPRTLGIRIAARLIDPLNKLRKVSIRYARQAGTPESNPDPQGSYPILPASADVPLQLANGDATCEITIPLAQPDDYKLLFQFVLVDSAGRTYAEKPRAVTLPDQPGQPLLGLGGESDKPKTIARWSCEVNTGEGATIKNIAGLTTIQLPASVPHVNAPQFKLFNAPSALVQTSGDFMAMVAVTNDFDPGGETVQLASGRKVPFTFQGAGLLLWQDEKNFVRFERCKGSTGGVGLVHRILVEVYKNGREVGLHYSGNLPDRPFFISAGRKGSRVQLLYSHDAKEMHVFQEIAMDFSPEILVGLSASNLSKQPLTAKFERFVIRDGQGKDVPIKPIGITRLIDSGSEKRPDGSWFVEGAGLKIANAKGSTQKQTGLKEQFQGEWTWSGDRQLLWQANGKGDTLTVEFPVETPGTYEIKGRFTLGPEYGAVSFALDSKSLLQGKPSDFYYAQVRPAKAMTLSRSNLIKGNHRLTVTMQDRNAKSKGYHFGIDELVLVPAGTTPAKP
jgi:S1-C subfamily serine protease